MNDESDKPLNPPGDDALEARIVAWVLGEASSFEAAELDKLCAADPELRCFERRIRDLHGLIGDDAKVASDSEWKLPEAKREKITDLLGTDVVRLVPEQASRRYFGRRALLAAAACVMISVIAYSIYGSSSGSKEALASAPKTQVAAAPKTSNPAGSREERVARLRLAVQQQEDSVEDKRKLLSQIIRQEGIIYKGDQSLFQGSGGSNESDDPADTTKALLALQQDQIQLETQIENLLKYDGEQLMNYAGGLSLPGNVIPELLPQYQKQKREYEALKGSGLAAKHPEMEQKAAIVERTRQDLTEATANLRETLKAKLELANEQTARLEARMAGKKNSAIKKGIANQAFVDVKGDFESSQRVLEQLKVELIREEAGIGVSESALALNELASADAAAEPMTRGPAPAKPAIVAERQLPQIARAKESLRGGVAGAMEMAESDSFADAGPAAVDSLASNTESSRGQAAFGRGTRGDGLTDLAGASALAEAESAPANAPLNELADLAKEPASAATATPLPPVAPAAMPAEPGVVAGKEIARFRSEVKSESAVGLNADAPADMEAAAANFFNQPKPGSTTAAAPGQVSGFLGAAAAGGDAPVAPSGGTSFESPPAVGAPLVPVPAAPQLFGLSEGKSAESPVGEVAQSLGRAEDLRKVGKYEEARQIADAALKADPNNAEAKLLKEALGNPIGKDLALNYQSKAGSSLDAAQGAYNLGKYDEATRAYEEVLRVDPFNEAARRGMERTAQAKTDYYRAAYDHTRSELLSQVDSDWELKVPDQEGRSKELKDGASKSGGGDYSGLAQKEMIRRQTAVDQSDALRDTGREAYSKGDYQQAVEKYKEAIRLLPDAPMVQDRRLYLGQMLSDGATALGQQYTKTGDKAKARELAVGILSIDPGNAGAKALLLDEKPAPDEKSDETSATAQPFSTFSLHVSDASFKLAKAALERGEQPDPESIRHEEFYNAFDYGDPAPGRGEPVACVVEQCANPVIPQRNLVRIGVRAGASGRGQSTPLNLTLLLDSSGSMEREDRHQGMSMAVQQLAGLLKEGDTVSVIGFSRQPRLLVDRLPGTRAQELNTLLAQTPSEGGTNLEEGLKLAEELAKRQFNAAAQNRIVLFTDGAANLGDAEPETLQAKVEAMRQDGIAFDAAGFGTDGLNDKLLERLTRNGNGRYYIVDRPEDADANFAKQLAGAFRPAAENVKVQVRFNPSRVGRYKLIGFEEHRLNKDDFRNDAVDAAEMAAEEAGNALYQIEPLPGGEGEIGEVSVRFRDAASGEMVERTWTIPYEAQAPAFDLATPSIQLAGLSSCVAEKLRQAPSASSIDFQQLGPIFAKVKARYPNSQAVSDLGAMLGKLK